MHKMHSAKRRCIGMVIRKLQTGFEWQCIQACRIFGYNVVEVNDILLCKYIKERKRAYTKYYG